jgi:hypothetical protein
MHRYHVIAVGTLAGLASALLHAETPTRDSAAVQVAAHPLTSPALHAGMRPLTRDPVSVRGSAAPSPRAPVSPAPASPVRAARAAATFSATRAAPPASLLRAHPTAAARRALPVRTNPTGVPFGSARARHAPANAALGGPATFDARKLVRR